MKILKKRKKKNDKLKSLLEISEEISFNETEKVVEELRNTEVIRDCFSEGDIDDKDVISRVKLF